MDKIPKCCGSEMRPVMETTKFLEVHCGVCGDIVYIKKEAAKKPQMLDD